MSAYSYGPTATHLHRTLMRVRPAPLASIVKKILGVRRIVAKTPFGLYWVDPVSLIGRQLLDQGVFEPDLTARIQTALSPGNTFVDLGANEGYFSIIAGKLVGAQGRVLAIEPQQRLRQVIERNAQLNDLTNIILDTALISDRIGPAKLALSPDTNPGSTGTVNATRYPVAWQEVEANTLQNVLQRHGIWHVDCLKIDIEGSEHEAIMGSKDIFQARRVGCMMIEMHHTALAKRHMKASDIDEFLRTCGYNIAWRMGDHYYCYRPN